MLPKLYINPGSTFVGNGEEPVSTPSRSSLTSPRKRNPTPSRASLYGTTFKSSAKEDYSHLPYKKYLDKLSPEMQKAVVDMRYTESRNNYNAQNPDSSADGIDQFLDSWEPDIIKHSGVKSKKEFLKSPEAQDKFFFEFYLPKKAMPAVERLKKKGSDYGEGGLFKMYHFQGERGARRYLSGESGETPQGDLNMPINKYLVSSARKNKKAMGGYLGNNKPKYKKELGGLLSTLSGAASGAAAGNSLLPGGIGAGIGGALSLVTSIAGNIKDEKIKKKIAAKEKANLDMQFQNNSEAAYSSYLPVNTGGFYAEGGAIPQPESYEAEKGEVVLGNPQLEDGKQIAEGIHEVGGKKHAEGGTIGVGGDFIFSDAILVPDSDKQVLKSLGLNLNGKKTYADIAKVIGKFKDKYDRDSNNYRKNNTDAEMSKRIEDSLKLLAQSQEQLKGTMENNQNNYALGGYVPDSLKHKYTGTKNNPILVDYANIANTLYNNQFTGVPKVTTQQKRNVEDYDFLNSQFKNLPKAPPKVPNYTMPPIAKRGINENNLKKSLSSSLPNVPTVNTNQKLTLAEKLDGKGFSLSGALSSTAGYLSDLNTARKMETDIPLYVTPKSQMNYTDRSGYMMDRNSQSLHNFLDTRTGTPKNIQGAFASTLKADAQVGLAEAERQDKAKTDYNNKNMYIDSQTAQQYNRNAYLENNLVNTKNENVGGAFSSYLGNLDTVRREQNSMELDNKKLDILRAQADSKPGLVEDFLKVLQNSSKSTIGQ